MAHGFPLPYLHCCMASWELPGGCEVDETASDRNNQAPLQLPLTHNDWMLTHMLSLMVKCSPWGWGCSTHSDCVIPSRQWFKALLRTILLFRFSALSWAFLKGVMHTSSQHPDPDQPWVLVLVYICSQKGSDQGRALAPPVCYLTCLTWFSWKEL